MILFWKIALFLLSANFLMENMGVFTHQLNLSLGLLLIISFLLLYLPIHIKLRFKFRVLIGLVFIALGIVLFPDDLIRRAVGLSFFVFGFDQLLKASGREERELFPLLFTSGGYAFFLLLYKYTTFPWSFLQTVSLSFSRFASFVIQKELLVSTTFMGLPSLILFLLFIGSSSLSWKIGAGTSLAPTKLRKKMRRWGVLFGSILAVQILYIFIVSFLPGIPQGKEQIFIQERLVLYSPLFHTILLLIPLYLYLRFFAPFRMTAVSLQELDPRRDHGHLDFSPKTRIVLSALSLLILVVSLGLLTLMPARKMTEGRDVVFYEEGFLNWLRPSFEEFGEGSAGMFGNLPLFVERMGFPSRRVSEITPESLDGAKVLVLINIIDSFSPEELEAIWEFVREGGSLLMIGDHTFKKGEKNCLNEVLAPVHIKYNFDSGEYFIGGWLHSFEYFQHPLTVNLGDQENEPGIVVGASLQVHYPAFPVVVGKYGFSDDANPEDSAGGYLGDLFYTPGEQLGDVILVAEEPYGRGKVLVFGDTSGFVNAILIGTHQFVNRVFTYLSTHPQTHAHPGRFGLALIGFLVASLLFWKAERSPLILILSLFLVLTFHHFGSLQRVHQIERPLKGDIAYVDISHNERLPLDLWLDRGVMGLHLNLMRNGYLSFSLREFSQRRLANCDLLILVAPSRPLSKKEVKWVQDYLSRGGDLIMSVGWEEKGGVLPLLRALDLNVENIPLGNFETPVLRTQEMVSFYEGWALSERLEGATQPICEYLGYPVILHRKHGKGDVVLIGDSSFFRNIILEHEDYYNPHNVSFVVWLLSMLRG